MDANPFIAIPAIVLPSGPVHDRFEATLYEILVKMNQRRPFVELVSLRMDDHDSWTFIDGSGQHCYSLTLESDTEFVLSKRVGSKHKHIRRKLRGTYLNCIEKAFAALDKQLASSI